MIEPLPAQLDLLDLVHDRLVTAIADGTLQPGQRITQEEVAARLGVSRQPVSHALQVLRRRGLLVESGKRGLVVAPLEPRRLRDLYQVRAVLDGLAASLAASRARDGAVSRRERDDARSLVRRGLELAETAPIGELIALDVGFHSLVHRLSGNDAIVETVAEEWPHFMRSMGAALDDETVRRRVWDEHAEILDKILKGEPLPAQEAARRHTERAGKETARRLEHVASVA
jgi:DNA-binding GntR family transcriptional regulator